MRWLCTLTALTLAGPAMAQQNDAEKVYRSFEKKLTAARAYKVSFDIDANGVPGQPTAVKIKGELAVATGNKLKITFAGTEGSVKMGGTVASDGRQLRMLSNADGKQKSKDGPVPATLTIYVTGYIPRTGVYIGIDASHSSLPDKSPDKVKLSGFKPAAKDKSGKQETVIEFIMELPGAENVKAACKLWLDPRTSLPLKRTLDISHEGKAGRIVENYSNWQIDQVVRDADFKLPK